MRGKVVVADFLEEPLVVEREILGDLAEVSALGAEKEEQLKGRIEDADAVMLYHFLTMGGQTVRSLRRCRLIVRCGVGIDNVDWKAAAECGISVANVPDYGTEEVADSTMALMLALARGVNLLNSRGRAGRGAWSYTEAIPLRRLRGRVFGIVGLGKIGTAAAQRARAFGMEVGFYDPYVLRGEDEMLGLRRAGSLRELFEASDVVSLHCPLTAETEGMIDSESLGWMRPGSILVNTARGGLAVPEAVLEAVRSGRLAGAGLDVLPVEPPSAEAPLIAAWRDARDPAHDRIILCPHAAFYSEEGLLEIRRRASENCRRALLGEALRNVVSGPVTG
ncbi:MAG TPA: C-terminal binding protein [Verrucomicrobiales bacterium]|nr:C-terminal binding protein [Verrucomicrobiales bacterium]